VKGILLELVDGSEVSALAESNPPPSGPETWQDIIQAAVYKAQKISCRGVRMFDCSIYRVMGDKRTHQLFIVDLAQCEFKEEMYEDN
jgi:hypothetical protein